ncbi:MAG: hypothetical protein M3Y33_20670 [Actinomycetota bacterium]|nr:hypothetical protein [Actinomycetota bacterium]
MTERANTGVDRDPLVSRANVEGVLGRVGLGAEEIAAVLDGVEFPARLSHVQQRAARHGIPQEQLIDRMGGSP